MNSLFYTAIIIISILFLVIGNVILTYGKTKKKQKRASFFSATGWILFGIYWSMRAPDYYGDGDVVNALFAVAALPFFGRIAQAELKIKEKWINGLRFLSTITTVSMIAYLVVNSLPVVEGGLEYLNAYLVAGYLTAVGFPCEAEMVNYAGNSLWYRKNELYVSSAILHNGRNDILISLSCTAFPTLVLFTAAILGAAEKTRTRIITFLLIIPSIIVLNIIRMAMITYLTYTGITTATIAHNVIGKTGSLLALLFFAWVLFTFHPSILDRMEELMEIFFGKNHKKKSIKRKIEKDGR